MTKCDMVHGALSRLGDGVSRVISNKAQLIFDICRSALEQASAGTLRALGITSPQRWPGVPAFRHRRDRAGM